MKNLLPVLRFAICRCAIHLRSQYESHSHHNWLCRLDRNFHLALAFRYFKNWDLRNLRLGWHSLLLCASQAHKVVIFNDNYDAGDTLYSSINIHQTQMRSSPLTFEFQQIVFIVVAANGYDSTWYTDHLPGRSPPPERAKDNNLWAILNDRRCARFRLLLSRLYIVSGLNIIFYPTNASDTKRNWRLWVCMVNLKFAILL